jgi:hypothetical protein
MEEKSETATNADKRILQRRRQTYVVTNVCSSCWPLWWLRVPLRLSLATFNAAMVAACHAAVIRKFPVTMLSAPLYVSLGPRLAAASSGGRAHQLVRCLQLQRTQLQSFEASFDYLVTKSEHLKS